MALCGKSQHLQSVPCLFSQCKLAAPRKTACCCAWEIQPATYGRRAPYIMLVVPCSMLNEQCALAHFLQSCVLLITAKRRTVCAPGLRHPGLLCGVLRDALRQQCERAGVVAHVCAPQAQEEHQPHLLAGALLADWCGSKGASWVGAPEIQGFGCTLCKPCQFSAHPKYKLCGACFTCSASS